MNTDLSTDDGKLTNRYDKEVDRLIENYLKDSEIIDDAHQKELEEAKSLALDSKSEIEKKRLRKKFDQDLKALKQKYKK